MGKQILLFGWVQHRNCRDCESARSGIMRKVDLRIVPDNEAEFAVPFLWMFLWLEEGLKSVSALWVGGLVVWWYGGVSPSRAWR